MSVMGGVVLSVIIVMDVGGEKLWMGRGQRTALGVAVE